MSNTNPLYSTKKYDEGVCSKCGSSNLRKNSVALKEPVYDRKADVKELTVCLDCNHQKSRLLFNLG